MYNFPTKPDAMQQLAQLFAPALAKQMGVEYKHTTPTGTPSTPYYHGPGGLFGVAGVERDIIHTRVGGRGLAWALSNRTTITTDPLFPYISGYQDESGDEKDGVCDDPPIAGPAKTCLQTAPLGRYERMSREMEINRVGQIINRGEFTDLRTINDPIAPELGRSIFPNIDGSTQLGLGAEVLARMLEVGITFVNLLGRQLYTGSPANNSANSGYKEFIGLDLLIGTNKVDAITGTNCPSLDSDVKDYNYEKVSNVAANPSIVRTLTTMWRYVKHIAIRSNLMPVTWAISMRQALFWEITDVWPCSYLSYRCEVNDGANIDPVPSFDTGDAIAMRDAMRNGEYLLIDGEKVPIIIDDFIVEESSNDTNLIDVGCFASDIYIVPLSILGGRPATYWEYFDYSRGPAQAIMDSRSGNFFWTDGGRYMWHQKPPLNWCIQWLGKIEPRLILSTPHIAARLTNVQYCPLQHERDPHPDDDYFTDGGVTDRDPPSLYNDYKDSIR